MNAGNAAHRAHGPGERQRIRAMPAHTHLERAQPTQGQPCVERAQRRPGAGRACTRLAHLRGCAHDDSRDKVRMPSQVLGRAVHDHSRADVERPAEDRCGKRVVDEERHSALARHLRDSLEVGHAAQRVGDGFRDDEPRSPDREAHRVQIREVDELDLIAGRLEILAQERSRAAVELSGRDDRRRAWHEGEDRGVEGGHTRAGGHPGFGAFELGDRAFQHLAVAVGVAPVVVPGPLAPGYGVVVGQVGKDVDRRRAQVGRERASGAQLSARMHCA